MATEGAEPNTPVRTTRRTFRVIEALKALDGATITEVAEHLDMPKSSVHNYLRTLEHDGFVVERDGRYTVGLRFLDLGSFARINRELYRVGKPEVDDLAADTGEIANLLVEEHGRGTIIYRQEGPDAVNVDSYLGQNTHLHTTALGKAVLAHLPRERVETIVDRHGLPARTENTITDRTELFGELDAIRETGHAVDEEERIRGLVCVALPILGDDGVKGAISVSGPACRLEDARRRAEIVERLRNAVNVIELNRTYA